MAGVTPERALADRAMNHLTDVVNSLADVRTALAGGVGHPADVSRVAGDVAIEFTTHAWDLEPGRALPDDLATDVLALVSPLLTDGLRQQFFAPQAGVIPSRRSAPAAGMHATSTD